MYSGMRAPVKPGQEKKIEPNKSQKGLTSMEVQNTKRHGVSEIQRGKTFSEWGETNQIGQMLQDSYVR